MNQSESREKVLGLVAEFENPAKLLEAAQSIREEGYKNYDCHSPFPIHGMDEAMGMRRSPLGFVVFAAGLTGCAGAMLMQWWMSAVDYPLVISGKPFFSYQAFIPVTFELTVLLSAFAAVFGMFHLNRMPQLFHNLFYSDRFEKVTTDGFFVSLEADDKRFDEKKSKAFLESIGATHVEYINAK